MTIKITTLDIAETVLEFTGRMKATLDRNNILA